MENFRDKAAEADIGLIGLAVMGQHFDLNMERNGLTVAVYNRTKEVTESFINEDMDKKRLRAAYTLISFISSLKKPLKTILLVNAGSAVDAVLEQLKYHLEQDDIIIDSGNSYFKDSERREKDMAKLGINFIGMGISGGEKGALLGPSMMPGGREDVCQLLMPIWEKVAAQAPTPCVAYMGHGGAGHFVKMGLSMQICRLLRKFTFWPKMLMG